MLGLEDLPGANGVGGHRHRPADFRGWETRRQLQRPGKEAIPEEHGDFVAPIGRQGQLAPADLGLVHDIVVDQRGQVNHLDDDRDGDMLVAGPAEGVGGQSHQGRAQVLALAVEGVIRVGGNFRVEGFDLVRQSPADGFQKRLDRVDDLLPGKGRLGARSVVCRCRH